MKLYLLWLGAGLALGIVYSLMGVRSPAPPVVALIGTADILLGEQTVPVVQRLFSGGSVAEVVRTDCADHVLGGQPRRYRGLIHFSTREKPRWTMAISSAAGLALFRWRLKRLEGG